MAKYGYFSEELLAFSSYRVVNALGFLALIVVIYLAFSRQKLISVENESNHHLNQHGQVQLTMDRFFPSP